MQHRIMQVLAAAACLATLCGASLARPAREAQSVASAYTNLPIAFEPNMGQTDPSVSFVARGAGYNLFLRANDATLCLFRVSPPREFGARGSVSTSVFRMKLLGARR